MSSRAATREYSHFLVKYDDEYGTMYTCPRAKNIEVGRIRIGQQYPVQYGNTTSQPEIATVLDTGDYMSMKKKQTEMEETTTSPVLSPPPAQDFNIRKRKRQERSTSGTQKKPRQEARMISTGEGNSDPYIFRSPTSSPELDQYLVAPSPPSSPETTRTTETQTTPTHKEPTAFSMQQTLQCIYTQLQISNTRLSEMERMIATQQTQINWLVSNQRIILTQPTTPTRPFKMSPAPRRLDVCL